MKWKFTPQPAPDLVVPALIHQSMVFMFHISSLKLHARKHHFLDRRITNRRNEEQGMDCVEGPRPKLLPHLMHCLWSQRNEIRECIVEEEDLMFVGVAREVQTRLKFT